MIDTFWALTAKYSKHEEVLDSTGHRTGVNHVIPRTIFELLPLITPAENKKLRRALAGAINRAQRNEQHYRRRVAILGKALLDLDRGPVEQIQAAKDMLADLGKENIEDIHKAADELEKKEEIPF